MWQNLQQLPAIVWIAAAGVIVVAWLLIIWLRRNFQVNDIKVKAGPVEFGLGRTGELPVTAQEQSAASPPTLGPVLKIGGDNVGGDKRVNQRAGGDIVGRDKTAKSVAGDEVHAQVVIKNTFVNGPSAPSLTLHGFVPAFTAAGWQGRRSPGKRTGEER